MPSPPAEWTNYLDLDRSYTTLAHIGQNLSPTGQATVHVYYWDVAVGKTSPGRTISRFISPDSLQSVSFKKGDKDYIRYFVLNQDLPPANIAQGDRNFYPDFLTDFGPPTGSVYGTKVQSNNTFFVWDPSREILKKPVFLKLPLNEGSYDGWYAGAVATSDYVEAKMRKSGTSQGSALPEHFAAGLHVNGAQYGFDLREADPINGLSHTSSELLPAHGLLGMNNKFQTSDKFVSVLDHYFQATGKPGLSRAAQAHRWIVEEFLPQFAKFEATMNFKYGIIRSAHLQNTLLEVNRETGKIDRIVFRDMQDTYVDRRLPIPLSEAKSESKRLGMLTEINNGMDVDDGVPVTAEGFARSYIPKSILDLTENHLERQTYATAYLKEYIQSAQEISGYDLNLSKRSKKYLRELSEGTVKNDLTSDENSGIAKRLASVVGEVYESINGEYVPEIKPAMFKYDQKKLADIFSKGPVHVVASDPLQGAENPKAYRYGFDGRKVIIFLRKSWKVLAYTDALSEEVLKEILPQQNWLSCFISKVRSSIKPTAEIGSK